MADLVTTRRDGAVLWVAMNRPEKRNALHREMLAGLVAAVVGAERDREVRAVVIHGEGRVFSAGVDFGMLAGDVGGERPFRSTVGEMQSALDRLEAVEKPVIAAMHRYAAGLALELALACDFRVATDDCELGLPEVKLGLVPDVGGTTRLVRAVGQPRAKDLVMTGRMIPAVEAQAIGLVTRVAPTGDHLGAAARLAEELAANAPLAVGLAKRLIDLGSNVDARTFTQMELLVQSILVRTDDAAEGARAAAERRPPRFTGR
jgi:enoyl-CoA hydratase/carnithine racemase